MGRASSSVWPRMSINAYVAIGFFAQSLFWVQFDILTGRYKTAVFEFVLALGFARNAQRFEKESMQ